MAYTKVSTRSFPTTSWTRGWGSWMAQPGYSVTNAACVITRTRTGDRVPNWRAKLLSGQDATSSLTARWDTIEYKPSPLLSQSWTGTGPNVGLTYKREAWHDWMITNSNHSFRPYVPTQDPTFVENLARAAFYKKVHSVTRKMQGLVFLGELGETLHMLRRPTESLHKLAGNFLGLLGKRKKANPKGWTKDLSNVWLEQAFGWRPFLNDCQSAVQAYEETIRKNTGNTLRISAGVKKLYDKTGSIWYNIPGSIFGFTGDGAFRVTYGVTFETVLIRYRAAVRIRAEAPRWYDSTLWGFRPEEFIPAAWELLPWSFLIDYFANIGDLLDAAVTTYPNWDYGSRSQVLWAINRRKVKLLDADNPPGANWTLVSPFRDGQDEHFVTSKSVSRSKVTAVPMPRFQVNFDLSDGQLGNCAALLAQANLLHPQRKPKPWNPRRSHD